MSVNGDRWKKTSPDNVSVNGIDYTVVKNDSLSLGRPTGPHGNINHAEMKLANYINDTYGGSNAKVEIAVQNTSNSNAGACRFCRGKDGGVSIGELGAKNPNMNITFYHGTTGVNP